MSLCHQVITQADALAEAVLAYETERSTGTLSMHTARLRLRMVDEARATQAFNDGARALIVAATAAAQANPHSLQASNDHGPPPETPSPLIA